LNDKSKDNQDIKSEMDDNESDDLNEDEMDDDINIEDEDLTEFGVNVGEDALKDYISKRMIVKFSRKTNRTNRESEIDEKSEKVFRPITPSMKNSLNQRKQTPV